MEISDIGMATTSLGDIKATGNDVSHNISLNPLIRSRYWTPAFDSGSDYALPRELDSFVQCLGIDTANRTQVPPRCTSLAGCLVIDECGSLEAMNPALAAI